MNSEGQRRQQEQHQEGALLALVMGVAMPWEMARQQQTGPPRHQRQRWQPRLEQKHSIHQGRHWDRDKGKGKGKDKDNFLHLDEMNKRRDWLVLQRRTRQAEIRSRGRQVGKEPSAELDISQDI